jgi:hypothetical protein
MPTIGCVEMANFAVHIPQGPRLLFCIFLHLFSGRAFSSTPNPACNICIIIVIIIPGVELVAVKTSHVKAIQPPLFSRSFQLLMLLVILAGLLNWIDSILFSRLALFNKETKCTSVLGFLE